DVRADHIVPGVREPRPDDEADVSRSDYSYLHLVLRPWLVQIQMLAGLSVSAAGVANRAPDRRCQMPGLVLVVPCHIHPPQLPRRAFSRRHREPLVRHGCGHPATFRTRTLDAAPQEVRCAGYQTALRTTSPGPGIQQRPRRNGRASPVPISTARPRLRACEY